jgi:Cu-processing system permease protein
VATTLASSPLETPLRALTLLNPVDLARVLLLLELDKAAPMGYTGAIFERFFGSGLGITIAGSTLVMWTLLPFSLGFLRFRTKDF